MLIFFLIFFFLDKDCRGYKDELVDFLRMQEVPREVIFAVGIFFSSSFFFFLFLFLLF